MSASIRVTTKGGREIERRLGDLVEAFDDVSDLMADIGLALESSTINRFASESGPDGVAWKPSIRAKEGDGKTLSDTGLLRNSIHSVVVGNRVEVGTNRIYAGVHQFGSTIRAKNAPFLTFPLPGGLGLRKVKEVKMPARPFLGLSADDEDELLAQTEDYVLRALGKPA